MDNQTPSTEQASLHGLGPLVGGTPCLDFVNTVDSRDQSDKVERLRQYADLVRWGQHATDLTELEAQRLLQAAADQPAEAAKALAAAIALREAIYRIFITNVRDAEPAPSDLNTLQSAYCLALQHAQLIPAADGYSWSWAATESLDRVIWPVARSAIELLTSPEIARIKECANSSNCGWLFLDRSKNGSRRWCSMEECGSRDKMRRQYARRRSERT